MNEPDPASQKRTGRVPPAHPQKRRKPLPWRRPRRYRILSHGALCPRANTDRLLLFQGARELHEDNADPFHLPGLHFVREAAESISLSEIRSGAVIMAGSGMCTGGRVRHHLRHNLSHSDSSVIFVGYAAEGTLARIIIEGATKARLFGEEVAVRANIHTINGFSAHADQRELLAWHGQTGEPEVTFLVYGDPRSMQHFARSLKSARIEKPELHERLDL